MAEKGSKRNRKGLIYAALALAVAIMIMAVLTGVCNREPYYQGEPFSYWLDRLPVTSVVAGGTVRLPVQFPYPHSYKTQAEAEQAYESLQHQQDIALKAVSRIGGRCLPLLIRRLQSKDSSLKAAAVHWAVKLQLINPTSIRTADMKRGQALTAIINQGYAAKPIFPDLEALTHASDPGIRAAAQYALQWLRPDEFERLEKLQKGHK